MGKCGKGDEIQIILITWELYTDLEPRPAAVWLGSAGTRGWRDEATKIYI